VNLNEENIADLPILAKFMKEKGWVNNGNFFPYIYSMSDSGCLGEKLCLPEKVSAQKVVAMSRTCKDMNIFDWRFHGVDQLRSVLNGKNFRPMLRFCSASKSQYVFGPDGKIYLCWFGAGKKEFEVGSWSPRLVLDDELIERWQSRSVATIEKCLGCRFALICGAGCTNKALEEHGKIEAPRCSDFEGVLSVCVPYLVNKLRKEVSNG